MWKISTLCYYFQRTSSISFIFMIDATSSMENSLPMAIKYFIDICYNLKIKIPGVAIKFWGIFYRDLIDFISDRKD